MNKFLGISWTVWSLIGIAVFNGLTAIAPALRGTTATIVNVILLILAGFVHTSHVENAALTGSTK